MNLIDQRYRFAPVSPIGSPLEQFDKVADREGVSPKISPRVLRIKTKSGSISEFGHEPSCIVLWTVRSHFTLQRDARRSAREPSSEAAAPRMLLGAGLRIRSQEVVEHVEKAQDMLSIVARLAGTDVIDNHVTDLFLAMLLVG